MNRKWTIGCMAFLLMFTNLSSAQVNAQAIGTELMQGSLYDNKVELTKDDTVIAEIEEILEIGNEEGSRATSNVARGKQQEVTTPGTTSEAQGEVTTQSEVSEAQGEVTTPGDVSGGQGEVTTPGDGSEGQGEVTIPGDGNEDGGDEVPGEEEESPFDVDERNWANAKLSHTYITRAKTTSYQLSVKKIPLETSNYTILWKSSNKKVATVDNSGNVTAIKKGIAIITCIVKTESGFEKRFTCEVTVTNPKFTKTTYTVAKAEKLQLEITGTDTTKYKISGSNDDLLKVYQSQKGLVRGKRIGTVTVTAKIDGIQIKCKVIVTNPKVKKTLFVMTKDQTDTIQVYNQSEKSKITYKTKNPKVASVSSKGKITPHKIGVAVIIVNVDQREFEITVSIGRPKAVAAIKNAQKVLGATYSQAYRMRRGYYDCSSLIWRTYMPTGITFGYSKYASNAPTAAGEAYYLVTNKKEISSSYVDEKKLQPGDVIFISSGYNGRFRNITHVVMYIGNDIIIHATPINGNCVQYGSYSKYKNTIVSIGRPTM